MSVDISFRNCLLMKKLVSFSSDPTAILSYPWILAEGFGRFGMYIWNVSFFNKLNGGVAWRVENISCPNVDCMEWNC